MHIAGCVVFTVVTENVYKNGIKLLGASISVFRGCAIAGRAPVPARFCCAVQRREERTGSFDARSSRRVCPNSSIRCISLSPSSCTQQAAMKTTGEQLRADTVCILPADAPQE